MAACLREDEDEDKEEEEKKEREKEEEKGGQSGRERWDREQERGTEGKGERRKAGRVCVPFFDILGLRRARVMVCSCYRVLGQWDGQITGCQSLGELGLKHVTVTDWLWVCWPWVLGVMLFLPCLVSWVVFFLFFLIPFFSCLPFQGLDRGLWFVYLSSGCFFLLFWWFV